MNYSKYQESIFDFAVSNPTTSFVVGAGAGAGKTSTLKELAKRLNDGKRGILFLAFNKSIANELQTKVGNFCDCKTLHAQGFVALAKAIQTLYGKKGVMDARKWVSYIQNNYSVLSNYDFESVADNMRSELISTFCYNTSAILDKCRLELIKSGDMNAIESVIEHYGLETIADEAEAVNTLLQIAYNVTETYDFTDMITIPAINTNVTKYINTYKNVFVDECQDLSKAQQTLMLASVAKGGRFIAVGDRHQAINGFAGADNQSFDRLVELSGGNEFPLSICYRCGKDIVRLANEIVPELEYWENSDNGTISNVTDLSTIRKGDMIICRKSAPLLGLALKMIAKGIPAKVKGLDIAKNLINMVTKFKAKTIQSLYTKLDNEYEKILKEVEKKGHTNPKCSTRARNFMDKYECIKVVADECSTIAEIKNKLESIFADYTKSNEITLSTIHKAKGLEADNVFIVLPNKLPLTFKGQKEWEYEQELNLKYVAITRAKKNLVWVNLDEEGLADLTF